MQNKTSQRAAQGITTAVIQASVGSPESAPNIDGTVEKPRPPHQRPDVDSTEPLCFTNSSREEDVWELIYPDQERRGDAVQERQLQSKLWGSEQSSEPRSRGPHRQAASDACTL